MFKFPPRYVPDNKVLALDPPYFPAWTFPLLNEPHDAGIPARAVEGGLRCIVDPWGSMDVGDEFKLYWKDTTAPVCSITIDADQKNNRLVFDIDESHILNGDASPVYYTVKRISQDPEEPDTKWNLLVKLDRPGGFDDDQATPGHSGLLYSIPQDIIDHGVGSGDAAAGVPITIKPYENMRRNDRINLAWGSKNVYHTVLDGQVDKEIIIPVSKEIIEAAGDSNGVAIAYQVVDVCGNYPGGASTWSAVTKLLVDLGNNRLEAPLVLVGGFPVEEIDLEVLAGADAIVRVTPNRTDHAVGDTLRMTWIGTPAEGTAVIVGPLDLPVTTIPSYCDFTIPYEYVAAIAKGRASVNYVRIRSGEADRPSKSAAVTVIGEFRRYVAPNINEAVGNTLDPALNFYTISVPYYAGRNPGDELFIVCEGRTASGVPTYYDNYASVGDEAVGAPVPVNLPKAEVQRLDGGSLTVYYSVNGQPPSDELTLSVGVAAPSLAIPTVVEADANDVLNPDDVNPAIGANVIVTYTQTLPDDKVVLHWRGSSSSAPDASRDLTANTAGKPVPFTVPFTYVSGNLNGTVDVSYAITRGINLVGKSIVRSLRIGGGLDLIAPSVKQATGSAPTQQLNPVAAKDALTVVIPDYGVQPGDKVSVTWAGAAGDGSHITPAGDLPANQEIALPVRMIAYNLDRLVTVTYTVIQNGSELPPSDPLSLTVQTLIQDDLLAAKPRILQAANNGEGPELDVATLTVGATIRIDNWPLIAQGQYVWLRVKGIKKDGTNYERTLWQAPGSRVSSGWVSDGYATNTVPLSDLRELRDGSTLTVEFKTTFNQSTDEGQAITFPLRTYTVKAIELIKPVISSVKGQSSNADIPNGGNTVETSVILSGTATAGMSVEIFDGTTSKGTADVSAAGDWSKQVTGLAVAEHRFTAKALYGSELISAVWVVTVARALGILVGYYPFCHAASPDGTHVYVTVPDSKSTAIVSTANNSVVKRIAPFESGNLLGTVAVAPNGTRAYIVNGKWNSRRNIVQIVDTSTQLVVDQIEIDPARTMYEMAVTRNSSYLYVYTSGYILVYDTATHALIKSISFYGHSGHTVMSQVADRAYCVGWQSGSGKSIFYVIDTLNHTVIHDLSSGLPIYVHRIALSPDGTKAYIIHSGIDILQVFDIATNQIVKSVSLPSDGKGAFYGLAVTPDGAKLYICRGRRREIMVFDTRTQTLLSSIVIPDEIDGTGATSITLNGVGTSAYISMSEGLHLGYISLV
ncbi:YncE family protein [Pseudomonas sp. SWRI102]|uniref:YncE family protein n=1 Tax=Pseudomonas marvdashtae TaxID=2745500 RepID=A0A923JN69_9PSED|nr:YncE family protein [Pseudomonas marvdashtae]MBV4551639.1 YncE family protein [Pseudomonas marvdashtae]